MGQVEANRSELRELMESWAARTDGRLEALNARIDARFDAMAANFDVRLVKVETRIEKRFSGVLKWSVAFWFGGIGAMAALLRLMK